MCKSTNSLEFFPDVIKNIASSNLQLRKLIYVYLLRYAAYEPDLALLSINTIQKSLSDRNPFIRSLAVRVMSLIKVPLIVPILDLAIKTLSHDPSPIVRRATVEALGNCMELDLSIGPTHLPLIEAFLTDSSPLVSGTALVVLSRHFSDRMDLLHKSYRSLCKKLSQFDEWVQILALETLVKYARMYIAAPSMEQNSVVPYVTHDLELLFQATATLLFSRNGAVVLAAARVYYYLGGPAVEQLFKQYKVAGFVVRLLRSEQSVQYISLVNIKAIAVKYKDVFADFTKAFLLLPSDNLENSKLKMDILTLVSNKSNVLTILSELRLCALTSDDPRLVSAAIQAMARCATTSDDAVQKKTLSWLLKQIKTGGSTIVAESLTAVRYLIQGDIKKHVTTLEKVAKALSIAKIPNAKASIIWLVGENVELLPSIAPDVLRICARNFLKEEDHVRNQIVLLAAKMYSRCLNEYGDDSEEARSSDSPIPPLYDYIMHMAKFDSSYDNRDRARLLSSLLDSSLNREIATLVLQAPKPAPLISLNKDAADLDEVASNSSELLLGSSSLLLGKPGNGYQSLPPWTPLDELVDSSVRDEPETASAINENNSNGDLRSMTNTNYSKNRVSRYEPPSNHGIFTAKKFKEQTLDEFFGEPSTGQNLSEEEYEEEEDDEEDEDDEEGEESEEGDDDEDDDEEEEGEYQEESEEEQTDGSEEVDDTSDEKQNDSYASTDDEEDSESHQLLN